MDKFIRDENLKLYRKLLLETNDAERRRVLQQLIAQLTTRESHNSRSG